MPIVLLSKNTRAKEVSDIMDELTRQNLTKQE